MAKFDFSDLNTDDRKKLDFSDLNTSSEENDAESYFKKLGKEIKEDKGENLLPSLAAGIYSGLGKGGQGIASALTGGYAPTVDFDQITQPSRGNTSHQQAAYGIGEYVPYGFAGGSSLAGQIAGGAGAGAALTKPEEENAFGFLPKGKLGGAIEGALINMLIPGGLKVAEKLRPSKMFRGNLSPEQLQTNLEAAGDTSTGLGSTIESPRMKKLLENELPQIPLTGADNAMLNTAKQIKEEGKQIFNDLGITENTRGEGLELQNALKESAKEARLEKEADFKKVNDIADKHNLQVGRNNFSAVAQDAINDVKESPELARLFPQELLENLKYYAANPTGNNLKLSNILKGKLGDEAHELYVAGKTHEYGIVKKMKDALQADIDEAIENSGSKDLKDQYLKAQTNYREKFAPFEDPDIVKFTRQGGDPDLMLSHFLRKGVNDRSILLSKITSKLAPSQKSLPLKMYLSNALEEGELNPSKLKSLYKDLGKNQRKALIQDEKVIDRLNKYQRLVEMNSEPLSLMANPKTGARNLGLNYTGSQLLLSGGGAISGGLPGALAATILPMAAGRYAKRKLTSPEFRKALVEEMIKDRTKFSTTKSMKTAEALAQSILNSQRSGEENDSR